MIDSPFDIREPEQRDGYYAALFLVMAPVTAYPFGRLGSFIGDYETEGALMGCITFYAFSVGFAISALRQPTKSTRIWGGVTLSAALLVGFGAVVLHVAGR